MTPHARLVRLAVWAAAANLALTAVAATLASDAGAIDAARTFAAFCGIG